MEARKRILAQLPMQSQILNPSPYLDLSLFSYDDKFISSVERPKTSGDYPIRWVAITCSRVSRVCVSRAWLNWNLLGCGKLIFLAPYILKELIHSMCFSTCLLQVFVSFLTWKLYRCSSDVDFYRYCLNWSVKNSENTPFNLASGISSSLFLSKN